MFLRFEKTTKQTKLANCWGHIKRNPWLLMKTQIYKIGVVSQSGKKNILNSQNYPKLRYLADSQ